MLSSLAADRARITDLDAEISMLERSLSELRIRRAHAQERLDSYKYPVLTLPTEIIVEIFIRFLPDYPLCPPLTGLKSPTLLTQICREWREIALETPELWRAIRLLNTCVPLEQQAGLCNLWLSRSRSYPLSIRFNGMREGALGLLSLLTANCARWEDLTLTLWKPQPIEGPMPLLRRLDLSIAEWDEVMAFQVTFCTAPLLHTAILNGIAAHNVILPWSQLTSLHLVPVSLRDCVSILRNAVNLLRCELTLYGGEEDDENLPRIALPVLRSLAFTTLNYDPRSVTIYLGIFDVPVLRKLRVAQSMLTPNPIDSLTSFLSKTGCRLHELCITGVTKTTSGSSYRKAFPSMTVTLDASTRPIHEF